MDGASKVDLDFIFFIYLKISFVSFLFIALKARNPYWDKYCLGNCIKDRFKLVFSPS
jgi:hypothetical protein